MRREARRLSGAPSGGCRSGLVNGGGVPHGGSAPSDEVARGGGVLRREVYPRWWGFVGKTIMAPPPARDNATHVSHARDMQFVSYIDKQTVVLMCPPPVEAPSSSVAHSLVRVMTA